MLVDSFKIYLLQIVILTIVSSCCAGELGFGDHGLSLGEIAVGHGEEEIGLDLGELGLVNISILFVNVINIITSKRATLEHRINDETMFYFMSGGSEHEIGLGGHGEGGHFIPSVKTIGMWISIN